MIEFTTQYQLLGEQEVFPDLACALEAADGDEARVWFIREADEPCSCPNEDPENWPIHYCLEDPRWDVQLEHGQYVDRVGYFVSTAPCRTGDEDTIFTH